METIPILHKASYIRGGAGFLNINNIDIYIYIYNILTILYVGMLLCCRSYSRMPVTTRTIAVLVGDPCKPSLATGRQHPLIHNVHGAATSIDKITANSETHH